MSSTQVFGRRGVQPAPTTTSSTPPLRSKTSSPASAGRGTLDFGWLLFSLDGRINRRQYWLCKIGIFIALRLMSGGAKSLGASIKAAKASHTLSASLLVVALVCVLALVPALVATLWAGFALTVKRWHDRDKPWTWALLGFLPVVGWLWQFVVCGFLAGTPGPNRFGPSPKGFSDARYQEMLAETFS